jgi:outer membrane protein TolC
MWLLIIAVASAERSAEPLRLSYEEALAQASRNTDTQLAEVEIQSARAQLMAARSSFMPTLSSWGDMYGDRQQQTFFGFSTFDSTRAWDAGISLSQYLSSGTGVSLSFFTQATRYLSFENALSDELPPPSFASTLQLTLTQSLLQGLKPSYNLQAVRSAQRAVTVAEAQGIAKLQRAKATAAHAYWALRYQQALAQIALQSLDLVKAQRDVVLALVDNGKLASVERTRIEAAVAEAESSAHSATLGASAASTSLALALSIPPSTMIDPISAPAELPDTLKLADVLERVMEGNPDLQALKILHETASLSLLDARHALLPDLEATGSYGLSGYEEEAGASLKELANGDLSSWSVGLTLTVPIGELADRGALGQKEAEVERLRLQIAAMELSLETQARNLQNRIAAAALSVSLARTRLGLQEELVRVEEARFAEGKSLQKDVLTAIRDLESARIDVQKAEIDLADAWVDLSSLMGLL